MRPLPPNLEIYTTSDGSPTLSWQRADGYVEKMHHSGGALEESIYIYHQALGLVLNEAPSARVLSIGLGLGYNELLCLSEFCKRGITNWRIWSFEAHPDLRHEFADWLTSGQASSELSLVHEKLLNLIAQRLEVPVEEIRSTARAALQDGRLQLRHSFPDDIAEIDHANLILYDAYSKKMDPHLWDERALIEKLGPLLDDRCFLATYAATGSLNRALKGLGFSLIPKPGFLGKRESTLARRELKS